MKKYNQVAKLEKLSREEQMEYLQRGEYIVDETCLRSKAMHLVYYFFRTYPEIKLTRIFYNEFKFGDGREGIFATIGIYDPNEDIFDTVLGVVMPDFLAIGIRAEGETVEDLKERFRLNDLEGCFTLKLNEIIEETSDLLNKMFERNFIVEIKDNTNKERTSFKIDNSKN